MGSGTLSRVRFPPPPPNKTGPERGLFIWWRLLPLLMPPFGGSAIIHKQGFQKPCKGSGKIKVSYKAESGTKVLYKN
jgi:hypothetical protein